MKKCSVRADYYPGLNRGTECPAPGGAVLAAGYVPVEARGRAVISAIKPGEKALVLIGRNYNTCDSGVNMNLPAN